ncbi:hypothetical protein PROFUN_16012 [Planoprotostelium fungivorum]|uniref:Uncharacterized protein n=1 Tax=Planoprotostelium fungivorum TaxID=1890364 RepID=A0A2P6MT97_9EUKA|nr:hypothetical protein PROFUN_16012 [Planoprotostelium fungivorum]
MWPLPFFIVEEILSSAANCLAGEALDFVLMRVTGQTNGCRTPPESTANENNARGGRTNCSIEGYNLESIPLPEK